MQLLVFWHTLSIVQSCLCVCVYDWRMFVVADGWSESCLCAISLVFSSVAVGYPRVRSIGSWCLYKCYWHCWSDTFCSLLHVIVVYICITCYQTTPMWVVNYIYSKTTNEWYSVALDLPSVLRWSQAAHPTSIIWYISLGLGCPA